MTEIVQSVKNQDKRDMDGIMEMFNENKTKCNSDLLQISKNRAVGWKRCRKRGFCDLEREGALSL